MPNLLTVILLVLILVCIAVSQKAVERQNILIAKALYIIAIILSLVICITI